MRLIAAILLGAMAPAASPASAAPLEPSFVPVFRENFPDAFVLQAGGRFIAYATNDGPNVPMATSRDLVHWTFVTDSSGRKRDALPRLGSWAKTGFTWAPEVIELGTRYLLYYTASDTRLDAQCVGVAEASDPLGPFIDTRPEPIVCQEKLGGSIDASPFRDHDGKLYLYFKNDGNRVHARTSLWGQPLAPDGLSVTGEPVELVKDDQRWEERVVEAPTMVRSPTGYELFFSGGFFGWNPGEGGLSPYAMGYATCASALGPCAPASENPILHSFYDRRSGCLSGPGHQSIFTVGEQSFMSFHAWEASSGCRKVDDRRYLYVAPLSWKDGKPRIGPSLR
ncbi:MAG TPA: glycoside hydrolase family 43 protein [Sphingomicrobium sp.]|nr:glycoside hydrolase family 43 protein [Sphingomicrobium sp.]